MLVTLTKLEPVIMSYVMLWEMFDTIDACPGGCVRTRVYGNRWHRLSGKLAFKVEKL